MSDTVLKNFKRRLEEGNLQIQLCPLLETLGRFSKVVLFPVSPATKEEQGSAKLGNK